MLVVLGARRGSTAVAAEQDGCGEYRERGNMAELNQPLQTAVLPLP